MPKDRQFDIILFDLEGTLVDFQWRLDDAVKKIMPVLSNAGIDTALYGPYPSYATLFNTTRDITSIWETVDSDKLFNQLDTVYDAYDRDALSRWKPYSDTQLVLEALSQAGYRMGVVSNCGSHAAKTVLKRFNLSDYFELILSRDDVSYLKPNPEGLNLAIETLGTSAGRTLFVGDSKNDILAADRIFMPSCFLSGGESFVTGENGSIANFKISSLSNLNDILL